jgi:hypothetical protein
VAERRREQRWRTYLGGEVDFHPRCARLDCLVRNLSSNGARLVFDRPVTMPDQFTLVIPHSCDHRNVRIVWRSATEAGVMFEESPDEPVISLSAMRRIRRLEEERDALTRQLSERPAPSRE